jgi:hypothetical protein
MPLQVFLATLREHYQNDLDVLMKRAKTVGENVRLSQAINGVFSRRAWRVATARKYATTLKRILGLLNFPDGFVDTLRLVQLKKAAPVNGAISNYGSLPEEHRARLEGWVEKIRDGTRNTSELSIRNVMSFYTAACLPAFGLNPDTWPEDAPAHVEAKLTADPQLLQRIVGDGPTAGVKATRLQFLLNDILGVDAVVPKPRKRKPTPTDADDDDGRDVHRISAEHLELIHAEARKSPLDELLFMLMLTTGLRIGGVTKILTRNVADVKGNLYLIKIEGKTKEKGNKFARFVLSPRVRELMHAWLTHHRPADEGPYLFPGVGQGGHVSTDSLRARFQRLCKNAGLEGTRMRTCCSSVATLLRAF